MCFCKTLLRITNSYLGQSPIWKQESFRTVLTHCGCAEHEENCKYPLKRDFHFLSTWIKNLICMTKPRGVENIRDIRDEIMYTPSGCTYKVYIIDEVHMLTSEAFNALLKTLEEPPAHAIFILATTEPHKIPATVLSR